VTRRAGAGRYSSPSSRSGTAIQPLSSPSSHSFSALIANVLASSRNGTLSSSRIYVIALAQDTHCQQLHTEACGELDARQEQHPAAERRCGEGELGDGPRQLRASAPHEQRHGDQTQEPDQPGTGEQHDGRGDGRPVALQPARQTDRA
jgi:hypothetical protein